MLILSFERACVLIIYLNALHVVADMQLVEQDYLCVYTTQYAYMYTVTKLSHPAPVHSLTILCTVLTMHTEHPYFCTALQMAYTEMFFVDKYWPQLSKLDYRQILHQYASQRSRRFGV